MYSSDNYTSGFIAGQNSSNSRNDGMFGDGNGW